MIMNQIDNDPVRIYQIFNEGFNKITKHGDITFQILRLPVKFQAQPQQDWREQPQEFSRLHLQ